MQVHLRICGQVQGVFFRYSAKEQAEKLKLTGWVRNNPDGSVETLIEGKKDDLERFLAWCQKGPPGALVEKVNTKWGKATGEFGSFEIVYG